MRIPPTRIWLRSFSSISSSIADAINHFDGTGLWDETDWVLLRPLACEWIALKCFARARWSASSRCSAVEVLEDSQIETLKGFGKRGNGSSNTARTSRGSSPGASVPTSR